MPVQSSALSLFLNRLESRSSLNDEEREAVLALPGTTAQIGANRDFVALSKTVDYACLVVDGLIGRFSQTFKGNRQITALYIPGDMPGPALGHADQGRICVPGTYEIHDPARAPPRPGIGSGSLPGTWGGILARLLSRRHDSGRLDRERRATRRPGASCSPDLRDGAALCAHRSG